MAYLPRTLLVIGALLAACGDVATLAATSPFAEPTPPALELPAGVPDTAVGHQFAWFLDLLNNRDGIISTTEATAHLDPSWLAKHDAIASIVTFYRTAQTHAPMTVDRIELPAGDRVVAHGLSRGFPITLSVTVDGTTGLVRGIRVKSDLDTRSFADIATLLPTLAPHASMLVAELDGQDCGILHAVDADRPLEIASTHKLYILLALADHIAAGKATWDTPLAIRDAWRSRSSGDMHDEPAGTQYSLLQFARAMIVRSDNTATDHLLFYLGRESVEAAMRTANHADPDRNTPFLATRELFLFYRVDEAEVERYLALSTEKRRRYVDDTVTRWPVATLTTLGSPFDVHNRHVGKVGWLASVTDLCHVMATLRDRARTVAGNEVLLDILSAANGIRQTIDETPWLYLGNKEGGLPGVHNSTWLLHRKDDRAFVVSLGFNHPSEKLFDRHQLVGLARRLIALTGDDMPTPM